MGVGFVAEGVAEVPGDGFALDGSGGLDEVEGAAGAGHANVGEAEVSEVALLGVVFGEGGELGVGLHAVALEGFENPVDAAVAFAVGGDASFGGAGVGFGGEDDGVVFESFGTVDGFNDNVASGVFVGAALGEEFVEAVEVALVLVLVIAGVFAESVEALLVALIVGGKFGADLIGGPFGGAGVAVEVEAVAEFRGAVGEFGAGGMVVEPLEVPAGEGIARVGGEAEELEEGRAGGVVGGGSGRGSGLDREAGDFGAEVIGEGGSVFVLTDEATDADFVLEGFEG